MTFEQQIKQQLHKLLSELADQVTFVEGQLLVVGCSTSEIIGKKIGTAGAEDIAAILYDEFQQFALKHKLYIAYQGCEHINRAITLEQEAAERYQLEPVSVVPVSTAGGSMSSYAYKQMKNPVVVEHITAHAGIDIGQTLIGMHLKHVAVPLRTSVRHIGEAVVTIATTRPKLIGGARAQYKLT